MRILFYGSKGLIGSCLLSMFASQGHTVYEGKARIENQTQIIEEILDHNPTHVFCATGRTHLNGASTIDGLEGGRDNLRVNLQDNLTAPLTLASVCKDMQVHLTIISTGCIYHSLYEGEKSTNVFSEDDRQNFFGSSYSIVKGNLNHILNTDLFSNSVLTLRIRLPILPFPHFRNSLTKLLTYPKLCSLENSITTFDLFEKYLSNLMCSKTVGLMNFTNKGGITHREIIDMYRQFVHQDHTCEFISREELCSMLVAERSNCVLDTSRLEGMFPDLPTAQTSMEECIKQYALNIN